MRKAYSPLGGKENMFLNFTRHGVQLGQTCQLAHKTKDGENARGGSKPE